MRARTFVLPLLLGTVWPARAGMTVYDLNDVVRLRLEDISFFTVLLLLCGFGIRFLWNYVAKDFPRWPRLTYGKALCLTGLLSLFMLLVLSMISGAREILTPGAWHRQGSHYKLTEAPDEPMRRQSLESLRTSLNAYAQTHGGKFPTHDFVADIPEKIWQAPDNVGTRYVYIGGLTQAQGTNLIACEPLSFGAERLALLVNGEILKVSTEEIRRRMGVVGASQ